MPYLTATNGPEAGRKIPLTLAKYILGRHPSCQIVIDHNSVSRQHAQIIEQESEFFIEDLQSRNGTSVNQRSVFGRQALTDGDIVSVCDFLFQFSDGTIGQPVPIRQTTDYVDELESGGASSVGIDSIVLDDSVEEPSSSTIMSKIMLDSEFSSAISKKAGAEQRLMLFIEITQALSTSLKVEEVLPKVLGKLFEIFRFAERGFIMLIEDGVLTPRWYTTRNNADSQLRVSKTIVDRVLETKEAIISKNASDDQRFETSRSIASYPIRSVMCAPLLDRDRNAIGCIQIDSMAKGAEFNYGDLEVLITVALQAGLAVVNARVHEEALEKREIERDMELGNEVQNRILPQERPKVPAYQFFDFYKPAQSIGGDYYDYVQLEDGRWAIIVADVVGHGIPAALLMVKFSAEARFALANEKTPVDVIQRLNNSITELSLDRFITMVLAIFDPKTHEFSIVNAGHNPPLLRKKDGQVTHPDQEQSGFPIGIVPDAEYPEFKLKLEPGETLSLFTDGMFECANESEEQFGINRLIRTIQKCPTGMPGKVGIEIVETVEDFSVTNEQLDDMCLVCVGRV